MNCKRYGMLAAALLGVSAFAEWKVDPVFSSNMMLQQERPIAFFGSADVGSVVKVEFAGKSVSVKPDAKGNWCAEFPALKAGATPYEAKISDGKKELVFSNLVIGDVWVCAGQSNMEMPIGTTFRRGWSAQNCEEEVRNADYPLIRVADQRNVISHNALCAAQMNGKGWEVCSPGTAGHFSATAYFFARQLHKDMGIPVGLINLTWSGTRIEPWISREGYEKAGLKQDLEFIRKFTMTRDVQAKYEADETARYLKEIRQFRARMDASSVSQKEACAGYAAPGFDDAPWAVAVSRSDKTPVIRWYRTSFEVSEEMQGKPLFLRSGEGAVARGFEAYLNGRKIAEVASDADRAQQKLSASIPADILKSKGKNVLAVRACYFYGGMDRERQQTLLGKTVLTDGKTEVCLKTWKEKDELRFDAAKQGLALPFERRMPYRSPQFYCNLYNGMVNGWTRLPIKGVIWYQGCANAGQIHYLALHKALIADWRAKWDQPKMPFLVVQLAGYGDVNWQTAPPKDAPYALTRDIQMQLTQDKNVGLACAIDIGEPANIHPANKQEVGRRLALEAERIAYGKKILSRGPIFDHAEIEGMTIRVFFENVPAALTTGDGKAPGAFALAGADRKFVWGNARIDGKTVVVSSPAIREPKFVRYAYVMYRGDCNLQNAEGLPAYPFRSDAIDYSKAK